MKHKSSLQALAGFAFICLTSLSAFTQDYCIPGRFSPDAYFSFSDIDDIGNVVYGASDNWFGDTIPQDLTFDIAFPDTLSDPLDTRPLIVLAHGGGFINGDKHNISGAIDSLACSGYVAVTLNYRLGWNSGIDTIPCSGEPRSLSLALYRAIADFSACMRYVTAHAAAYHIDTSQIFVGGFSAGSATALAAAICTQDDLEMLHPGMQLITGWKDSADNDIRIPWNVKGLLNGWGAVLDTAFIRPETPMPMISFFGDLDNSIPEYSGPLFNCFGYKPHFEFVYGPLAIAARMDNLGFCLVQHENPEGNHEAYDYDYVAENIACFVHSLLCDSCMSAHYANNNGDCMAEPLAVHELSGDMLTAYPDPCDDWLMLRTDAQGYKAPLMYDARGQKVAVHCEKQAQGWLIETGQVPSGMYYLQLHNTRNSQCIPFEVLH